MKAFKKVILTGLSLMLMSSAASAEKIIWPYSEWNEKTQEYNTVTAYCAGIYWEDEDNCYYDWDNGDSCLYHKYDENCESITADFCSSIPERFKSVREECFEQVESEEVKDVYWDDENNYYYFERRRNEN